MAKWKGSRVDCYFGRIETRRKKPDGSIDKIQKDYIVKVKPEVQDRLNLPIATPEQKTRAITVEGVGPRKVRSPGCKGGKHIRVPDPVDLTTNKGHRKMLQLPVPSNANIDHIEAFLKNTKANSFSIKGGGSYSVAGQTATPKKGG
jgi:hypothetical protein